MGIIDKFLGIFKGKEVVNEETVTQKVIDSNDDKPVIVDGVSNTPAMVRADDFQDSSVTPEEYKVADDDDDDEVVVVPEDTVDHGIDVSEGDDMSPIIMDVEEKQEVVEVMDDTVETIEEVSENIDETSEVLDEVVENVEVQEEIIESIDSQEEIVETVDDQAEVIENEEVLENDVEIL